MTKPAGTLVIMQKGMLASKLDCMPNAKDKPDALDDLLGSVDELVDSASKRMTAEEMREASKDINRIIDHAVAARPSRRRETA